jgi:cytochrome d ubiquinol oxidase subunit II
MLTLFGIIFRGTAFAFRYYDPFEDRTHVAYSFIFQLFSLLTPFFLGTTLGAVILGNITVDHTLPFYTRFVAPWFNIFSFSLGIFMVLLFAYLASAYLAGEPSNEETHTLFIKYSKRLLIALVFFGGIVFLTAEIEGLHLFRQYLNSWVSIGCVMIATLLLPIFLYTLNNKMTNLTRMIVGAQTGIILIGWFGGQFPILVALRDTIPLTVYNSVAPEKTLLMMIIALFVGLTIVIPLLGYLFKVFKLSEEKSY